MGAASAVIVIIAIIFFPPLGVFLLAGCGADFWINVCLTLLGYIPGHIHAFYLAYVYYDRREQAREGRYAATHAPGIYSDRVQTGGGGYGTIAHQT
ncbi:uncharacterized protein E0L32_001884 [Thyridium curvatum]|uniref:Plasma membrane proteolipid 3 n=1 Tax=Thyridium curvatum TaxID=1093900 RepID=A0A507AVF6_9PEZI|nr:uncharacterized protein E0L32_001795 [Thyridium curvatum]XP_030990020.1 uncharacterized protein E0L32_001884 [Thyridium curvatum]TPX08220.1 hypothetical protein E0L32_001795 [Thyridium curvatum]TPX08309.1 hypothetical protein E0L32_001884 [Thyridium curvatum]